MSYLEASPLSGKNIDKRKPSEQLLAVLASNIKSLRKTQGLSQERLGEFCNFHPTFISLIERRQRNVTISTLEIIANAFDVEVNTLLVSNNLED